MYLSIFEASWITAFVLVLLREHWKNAAAIDRFRAWNIPEEQIASFSRMMSNPKFLLIKLWASFFLGSILGTSISAIYWLLHTFA